MRILKQIVDDPAMLYYYGQKGLRNKAARERLAGWWISASGAGDPPVGTDTAQAQSMREDGLCFLPSLNLDADALARVHGQLDDKPLIDWYTGQQVESIQSDIPQRYIKLNQRLEDILACVPLVRLANDPLVLDTVGRVLGAKPTISSYMAWWTLGEHQAFGPANYDDIYHRDVDDLRFVKLFAYLTDATPTSGAHSFVMGSHRSPLFCKRGPISDEDVIAGFPASSITTLAAPAGTVFLEDTWGIHRPLLATEGRRMIFSVTYGLTPWLPGRPAKPLLPLPPGLDAYVNRSFYYPA